MTHDRETRPISPARRRLQRGMTLVELMVAMAIGVGVVLAITTLLVAGENHKRTTTSTNDAEQSGAYAFHSLDGVLRGAGSGFAESAYPSDVGVLGCRLNVAGSGATILPRPGAFPAPFAGALLTAAAPNLRVAPLLIAQRGSPDGVSDVLIVMGGSGAAGGVSRQVTGTGGAPPSLVLDNTVGLSKDDLALVSQSGTADCLLEQALKTPAVGTSTLALGSTYYTVGTTTKLSTLAASTLTYVTPIGNAQANNVQFEMFGVDANHTLYTYDLLRNLSLVQAVGTADAAQAIVDGVYRINAIYGIDTTGKGVLGAWAGPGDANYDVNAVMTKPLTIEKIIAVRVALVVRGEYYDKAPVSPATLTIFSNLQNAGGTSLQQTVNISLNDRHYRYRVFEFTVPLRNMILLAGGV